MAVLFGSLAADAVSVLALIVAVAYIYFSHVHKHWQRRGVRSVDPTPLVGNLGGVLLQKESLVGLVRRIYDEGAGRQVVGFFVFHRPVLMARGLDVVRGVLAKNSHLFLDRFFILPERFEPLFSKSIVAAKGRKWKHLRIKMTPTFTSGKIKMMLQLVDACSKGLLAHIDQEVSAGKSIAVKNAMSRYTMDAIASCSLGLNTNSLEDSNSVFITKMKLLFEPSGLKMLFLTLLVFFPWLQKLVGAKTLDSGLNDIVRRTFWDVVDHRRTSGIVRKDFVDLLMQLRQDGEVHADDEKDQEEIKQDSRYINTEGSKTDGSDITLDDDDIVAQAFIFIAAGYETSSSTMAFALYELALNPSIQDRLRREMEDVLEKYGSKVTYDALAEMSYLDMVVAETLRKYPPIFFLERKCTADCTLEGTDVTIEKGAAVVIPTYAIHYDPRYYPDPETFDPERFTAENKGKRPPFSYLPFGEGSRKCIGMRFAFLQMKIGLVRVLKTYQVTPCERTPSYPLEMKRNNDVLTPRKDIVLSFTKTI